MKKVYIAGRYSAPTVIEALANIRIGQRAATEALLKGYAVFCPWCDHQLFLQLREGESIDVATIKEHSMEWLKVSDEVWVLPGWETSHGTCDEIIVAKDRGIPVVYL